MCPLKHLSDELEHLLIENSIALDPGKKLPYLQLPLASVESESMCTKLNSQKEFEYLRNKFDPLQVGKVEVEAIEVVSCNPWPMWDGTVVEKHEDGHYTICRVNVTRPSSSMAFNLTDFVRPTKVRRSSGTTNITHQNALRSSGSLPLADCSIQRPGSDTGMDAIIVVRVRNEEILKAVGAVYSSIEGRSEHLSRYVNRGPSLHITLAKIGISEESLPTVVEALNEATESFRTSLATNLLTLTLRGIDSFGQKTLYAELHDGVEDIRRLAEVVKDKLEKRTISAVVRPKLHMTLVQINQVEDEPLGGEHFDELKVEFSDTLFGTQVIEDIELCTSGAWSNRKDYVKDFFKVLHKAELFPAAQNGDA